jgi:hypothetical protein
LFFTSAGFPGGKDKRTEKTTVMLTAYEVLKEPVTRILMGGGNGGGGGGDDPSSQNAINGGIADNSAKTETPSVKKRHRRMKSSSNKANDLDGKINLFVFYYTKRCNKLIRFIFKIRLRRLRIPNRFFGQ